MADAVRRSRVTVEDPGASPTESTGREYPMDARGGVVRRASWLLTGRIIGDAGLFVYYLLLARRFGAAGLGDYSFAFAVASVLTLGVSLGLRDLLTRRVARDPAEARKIAGTVLIGQFGIAIVVLGVLYLGARLLAYPPTLIGYLVLAFLALSLLVIGFTFTAFLDGIGAMHLSAIAGLIQKSVIVIPGIVLILGGASMASVMGAHVAAGFLFVIVGWHWTRRRFGSFRLTFRPALARTLFIAVLPFLATSALWEIYSRVDIVMLHAFRGEMETGLYAAAYKVVAAPLFVAELVGVAVFPTLARGLADDEEGTRQVFRETLRALTVLGLAGALLLVTVGDGLQVLLFGAEFAESGQLIRLMAPLFALHFLMVPLWRLLLAMDQERTLVKLRLGSVSFNVALNLVLIPAFGPIGAVVTSLISEGLLAIAQFLLCLRVVSAPFGGRGAALGFAAAAATGVGLAGRMFLAWPLAGLLAVVTFAALVFALRLVRPVEIAGLVRQARLSPTSPENGLSAGA